MHHPTTRARLLTIILAAGLLAAPLAASAMPSNVEEPKAAGKPANSDFADAKKAIDAKDWPLAIGLLKKVTTAEPSNPEAFNLLGFATRKSGDARGSLQYYQQALTLDAKHIGAHEYIGEAYLALNDLPKAEEHLRKLDDLCSFGCREYRDLKAAVEVYKKGQRPKS